mmetsp:Transcript_64428/g.179180  ORF Transcript_64428/g.179180 Transcript_64428/m.179180 type:complete len:428 (+) Transcript_64428:1833-3116(+)
MPAPWTSCRRATNPRHHGRHRTPCLAVAKPAPSRRHSETWRTFAAEPAESGVPALAHLTAAKSASPLVALDCPAPALAGLQSLGPPAAPLKTATWSSARPAEAPVPRGVNGDGPWTTPPRRPRWMSRTLSAPSPRPPLSPSCRHRSGPPISEALGTRAAVEAPGAGNALEPDPGSRKRGVRPDRHHAATDQRKRLPCARASTSARSGEWASETTARSARASLQSRRYRPRRHFPVATTGWMPAPPQTSAAKSVPKRAVRPTTPWPARVVATASAPASHGARLPRPHPSRRPGPLKHCPQSLPQLSFRWPRLPRRGRLAPSPCPQAARCLPSATPAAPKSKRLLEMSAWTPWPCRGTPEAYPFSPRCCGSHLSARKRWSRVPPSPASSPRPAGAKWACCPKPSRHLPPWLWQRRRRPPSIGDARGRSA